MSPPSNVSELLGLDIAKVALDRLESAGGAQAILLYGPKGAGKTRLAEALARRYLGEKAQDAFDRGLAPDVLRIAPEGPSAIIRLNRIVPVSPDPDPPATPSILEFTRSYPLIAENKVVIVEEADRMNDDAANSLLKPLEEPAAHVRYILTTSRISRLRATIVSRCVAIACGLPTTIELEGHFPDSPPALIAMARGVPGQLVRQLEHREIYLQLAAWADSLMTMERAEALRASDQLKELAAKLAEAHGEKARGAQALTLERLANYVVAGERFPPHWGREIAASHRAIIGNASSALVFDRLLTRLLRPA